MTLQASTAERIRANPKFAELTSKRNAFGWTLTIIMLVAYYGYVALIAFDKEFLAKRLSDTGVTTLGIPVGVGLIVFAVILTGLYVHRANSEFDALTEAIVQEESKQ